MRLLLPALALASILASILAACSKSPQGAAPDTASAAPAKSASAAPAATAAASAEAARRKGEPPRRSGPRALTKAEAAALSAYHAAMANGRKATRDKRFPEAIAAFGRALAAVPDDARAYSERGYAAIQAKDFKAAVADLDEAAAHTSDEKLLAQIWFNYGLAAEGAGDAERARAAFARSNALRPTKQAKEKLAGKSTCAATFEDGAAARETFESWKAAYEDIRKDDQGYDPWAGEGSLKAICGDGYQEGKPCLYQRPGVMSLAALYVPVAGGRVVRHELGVAGGRCGGEVEASIVEQRDGIVHARARIEQGMSVYLMEKNGEMVPCEGDAPCQSACDEPGVSYLDLFVDAATGRRLLSVSREARGTDKKDPLRLSLAGKAVTVAGASCDRTITLGARR